MKAVILRGKSQISNKLVTPTFKQLREHFDTIEVWTLNDDSHPYSTRHFDMHEHGNHNISKVKSIKGYVLPTDKRLTKQKKYPNLVAYPLREIILEFKLAYFTNTLCYQLALAIREGFDRIVLLGHDYWIERPEEILGTSFWMGIAHARGINFSIPSTSNLPRVSVEDPIQLYGAKETLVALAKEGRVDAFTN